ncbi:AtzH-like domain-containing protein [Amnibacterium flavum]|uniref:DUF3225 domain-containing protein n=1 Tax=Amnibacterium flavum TaxID=2173173 RepID=A0A2V1HY38_9MICO|nr:AtzH-like domain-containing protein [Amnibacterium flavum]PVZ95647.1 DUF3225 domain-containing protein [Amnibacterium flavum]
MAEFTVDTSAPVEGNAPLPAGLIEAFWRYERALMADDVPALDALFVDDPSTLRGDGSGLLVGHERIAAFRRGRGGAPKRRILEVHAQVIDDDDALLVAVLGPLAGGRGQQTQLWRRSDENGWQVSAAHVSAPAPAIDPRIWRIVGTPLVGSTETGPLDGETVAVKDLFSIAGHRVGAGVPRYLARATPGRVTAPAVSALLGAGATVRGIARTDEFAYSIAGVNPHYGTPPNAAVPGAIPGGSSSGPASAVASGQASIGLATDTAGSIRVPASYQGLWGLRTTHGAISADGLLPLAPSFDTVGWLTRSGELLARITRLLLPSPVGLPARVAIAPGVLDTLEPDIAGTFRAGIDTLVAEGLIPKPSEVELPDAAAALATFRTVQAAEAWRAHGAWITENPGAVSGAVAERFRIAQAVTAEQESEAREQLGRLRGELREILDDRVLLVPAAASTAPQTTASPDEIDAVRTATLQITCFAGIAGAPSVSAPLLSTSAGPLGLALVGPPGSDTALVDFATRLTPLAR